MRRVIFGRRFKVTMMTTTTTCDKDVRVMGCDFGSGS
jgi:hypothetical protein